MPLRLLVTRPRAQADVWVGRLRAQGVDAHALPLLAIDALTDSAALQAAWRELPRFALAMFVSPNAVAHFFAARPAGVAWPGQTRAAVTGPGSLQALIDAGVPAGCRVAPPAQAPQFDSTVLWAQLQHERWTDRRVLILRGDGGRDEFAGLLRDAGAAVEALQAYSRGPARLATTEQALLAAAIAAPASHLWWLSSAEATGYLPLLAPGVDWAAAQALASHPRIATRARELGFGSVDVAPPTLPAVLAALTRRGACLQSLPP